MNAQLHAHPHRRSIPRRLLRIFLRMLLTLFIILLLVFFLIQTPFIQNIARAKAETYLSRKLKAPVRIGHLDISFFRSVTLKDIYIEDRHKDTLLSAGLISVRLQMLALLHNNLDIREIHLDNLIAKVLRRSPADTTFNYQFIIDAFAGQPTAKPAATSGTPMKFGMKTLLLDNIRFVYRDTLTGNAADVIIGHSRTDLGGIGLDSLRFAVAGLHLQNTILQYRNTPGALYAYLRLPNLRTGGLDLDLNRLIIHAKTLQLDSAALAVDNGKQPRQKKGMDYYHLLVNDLTLHGQELNYTADSVSGRITKGALTEQSGFRLNQLQTRFFYSGHKAILQDLLLRTPGTFLQRSLSLQYDSVAGMIKTPAHTGINLDLPASRIQLKDILVFAPFLASQPVFNRPDDTWQINTRLQGSLDALTIYVLQFSGIRDIKLDVAGKLLHPMDSRRIRADLILNDLSGSNTALAGLLPKNTLPNTIAIPARFDLHGRLAGTRDDMTSDLTLHTTSGSVILKGRAGNFRSASGATYDLSLQTIALNLGAILRDSLQWGAVTAGFTVKGTGLDVHSANAAFTANIKAATIRQYTYQDLAIDGSLANQHAVLHSTINNPAIRFQLQATADLARKYPALQLDWNVDTVDLRALHLVKDTLQLKGHLIAGFADTNPDSLQGTLKLAGLDLLRGVQRLTTDSIVLVATRQQNIEDIQLHSEMADLDWKGRYKLTETATALEHTIDGYYHLAAFRDTAFTPQDWTMEWHLRASPLVLAYMPSLKGTDSLGGRMTFNSDRNDLHLDMRTPRIVFGTQYFHDVDINAATTGSSLHYALTMTDGHGSGFALYRTSLYGALRDNHLSTTLLLQDEKGKDRYRLAGRLDRQAGAAKFIFNPDSLLLNYDRWQVSRDNFLQYDSTGFIAHHVTISNNTDSLSLDSKGTTGAAPLDVRFGNFRLSTLSRLANQDSVIVDGTINGNAEIKNLTSTPVFTSDLKIVKLSYKVDTLGDLAIKVNNEKANAFAADIALRGNGNDVKIKGEYYTGESRMDLKLDLNPLNLATCTNFSQGAVENMKGYLKGQLAITGTIDKPGIKGNLYFDSSTITPTISGEPLKVFKDRIAFDEDGINFSQFRLEDSAGNKLILDGNVFTKDYRDFGFDVSLNANNFRLINAPENSSREFYGQLTIDAAINLEGKLASPKVDGDIRVNRKTNFFFVLPSPDPEVVDRLGVVRFVDRRTGDTLVDRKSQAIRAKKSELKGFDLSLNLQTDSNAVFNMVVDERSGDALTVRGRSNLVFGMDKSGRMDLTGSYEVESGYYSLSFNLLKRKFAIDRGSTITWTGDPTTATLNLTASYTALTPSIDLIANEVAGRSPSDVNKFKQKLPFLVTLKMEGELLKPKIAFDISLPTNVLTLWPDVDARLQQIRLQESELNKQVFALLVLNRFVGEDPLQSKAGGGVSVGTLAFQSASQILTNQLDQLAASLIRGVDIHLDLNQQQDFTTGSEIDYTELNVGVSKRLFSERIQVSVGSNFDVMGTGAPRQNASNLAGNVAVDYKLSRDGRYMLRAYRQNQYEAVVEGQVVETGLAFILTFDYNKFKEIFHKSQDDRLQERKTSKPGPPSNDDR